MEDHAEEIYNELFGEEVSSVIEFLIKKGEASNEEISRKLKINPNELRRILYLLEEHNIVSSRKVGNGLPYKFTYIWKVNVDSVASLKKKLIKKQISLLKERLKNMDDYVFVCPLCNLKFKFEEAIEYEFRCPEDGEVLIQKENEEKKRIIDLIKKLEREVEVLS